MFIVVKSPRKKIEIEIFIANKNEMCLKIVYMQYMRTHFISISKFMIMNIFFFLDKLNL